MADKNFIVKNGLEVGGQEVVSSSGVVTSAALGGQTLASTDSPTFNNLTLTNDIAVGGDLNLTGDLNITGDVNSLSVTDLDVTDQTITLGAGQVESASGGSGIVVDGSGASILWDETNDEWDFNKDINVTGTISSGAITSTGAIKTDYSDEISMDYTPNLGAYYKGMSGRNQSSSTARGLHIFNYDNDSNEGINFWVGTNSSKVFAARINSSGNVGIGETDPNAQLHIGSSNATGDATNPALQIGGANTYRLGMYTDNETAYIENKNGDDGIAFRVKTAGEAMRIDGGTGNVGIGTTSPASFLTNATALEISGGTGVGSELILTNNSSMSANEVVGSLIFKNTDPSGAPNHFAGLRARAESTFGRMDLEFYAGRSRMEGGTPDMVIIPNGADAQANVGIGTDLPSSKLHISGINTTGGLFVEDSSASAASPVIKVQGRRSDGNLSQSFSGGISLESLYTGGLAPDAKHTGTIYFGTNHTDGTAANIAYSASISGILEGAANSASDMPTGLVFYTGDTGTALGAANTTYGTERMRIDSSGNVGIGTDSPAAALHAHSTIEEVIRVDSGNTGAIHFFEGSTRRGIIGYSNASSIASNADAGDMVLRAESGKKLHLAISGTSKMVVNSSGNVGIGTNDPDQPLHVVGTRPLRLQRSGVGEFEISIDNVISGDSSDFVIEPVSGSNSAGFQVRTRDTAGSLIEALNVNHDGHVGIGTDSPTTFGGYKTLHFKNTGGDAIQLTETDGGVINQILCTDASAGKVLLGSRSNHPTIICQNDTERMRIDSSGRVGINRTPAISNSKLEIGGADNVQLIALEASGYTGGLGIGATGLQFFTDSTVRSKIDITGEFLINRANGFGTAGACALFVTGRSAAGIYLTGSNTSGYQLMTFFNGGLNTIGSITNSNNNAVLYNTTSDYRLKENVDYTWDATTRLKQLKPARFNWISDETDTTVDGFLAHEVTSIVPEAITGSKDATKTDTNCVLNSEGNLQQAGVTEAEWTAGKEDGTYDADTTWTSSHTQNAYQSIDHSKLVPLLVKTIQELEARITELEG